MEFLQFKQELQNSFKRNIEEQCDTLYEVEVDKDELWNLYLDSFKPEYNKIYRERREYDCSCCRQFIKSFGNVVGIKDNKIISIWDFKTNADEFDPVLEAMSGYIHTKVISDVHISKLNKIGTNNNFEGIDGKVKKWEHFYLELPNKYVTNNDKSEGDLKGSIRDIRNVFKRSLEEITEDAILAVLEISQSKTLYKGEEWILQLQQLLKYKKEYEKLSGSDRENYTWYKSVSVGGAVGKIKNHSIGVLLMDISKGEDLDKAVRKYESIVAPHNYKRPKPIYTKNQIEKAKLKISELGYMNSLNRRYAKLDDITINNVLFADRDSAKKMAGENIFDEMVKEVGVDPKKYSKVQEVSINEFINNILPNAKSIEALIENKHASNFVSLIAPSNINSKSMFKWSNNFSWAYTGNITDSSMKEKVKSAGGKVDGVLRFSIQWNDGKQHDKNDLDAHCIEPNGNRIYFSNNKNLNTTGMLDVDIRTPSNGNIAVENITWSDLRSMKDGTYKFMVHQYANRGGKEGFRAEIEFNGEIYSFDYSKELKQDEYVDVAEVVLKDGMFSIKEKIKSTSSSREFWNINTNQFVPVSAISLSPNYWDEQNGVGNKHFMFYLKGCINDESPNAFYNEFLNQELNEHRKVMEALGTKLRVQDSEEQLNGVGFSSTKRSDILVKVVGKTERIIKIKF